MRKHEQPSEDAKLTAEISVYCDPRLKQLAGEAADAAGIPLSEYIVRMLAKELRKPELAKIPRKPMGRPRKDLHIKQPA